VKSRDPVHAAATLATDVGDVRVKRTRRRGEHLEEVLIEAAVAELSEVGYAHFSMERVATRAGTGKASLYRRWRCKSALMSEVLGRTLLNLLPVSDTGSVRGDVIVVLRALAEHLGGPAGQALRGVLGASTRPNGHAELACEQIRRTGRRTMREILRRALERHDHVRDDITNHQLEIGFSLVLVHVLGSGHISDELIAQITDDLVVPLLLD
jgi:AcrR family transcriptional regulator